jgi:hypothetical protein
MNINILLTGHYVLICGFDAGADMFEIRDPASSRYHFFPLSTNCLISCIIFKKELSINVIPLLLKSLQRPTFDENFQRI